VSPDGHRTLSPSGQKKNLLVHGRVVGGASPRQKRFKNLGDAVSRTMASREGNSSSVRGGGDLSGDSSSVDVLQGHTQQSTPTNDGSTSLLQQQGSVIIAGNNNAELSSNNTPNAHKNIAGKTLSNISNRFALTAAAAGRGITSTAGAAGNVSLKKGKSSLVFLQKKVIGSPSKRHKGHHGEDEDGKVRGLEKLK
jgi:hypothetical protein